MKKIWMMGWLVLVLAACEKEIGLTGQEQLATDIATIDAYLEDNNIQNVLTDPSGLRYVIKENGTGSKPNPGNRVKVDYTGRLITGAMFDTSVEADAIAGDIYNAARNYAPIDFTLGVGQVISGWDIGIGLLNEKTKATLYIPSPLGYGVRSQGIIPPNSILVFEVDLIEVLN